MPSDPSHSCDASGIGAIVKGRGIYCGPWEVLPAKTLFSVRVKRPVTVHAYVEDGFLTDQNGNEMLLTFDDARTEVANRNGGWMPGDSTEAALRAEVGSRGTHFEGKLILPPLELLRDYDMPGQTRRTVTNVCALLASGKLPTIANTVATATSDQRRAVTGTQNPDNPTFVAHVSLADRNFVWSKPHHHRSGVLPFRLFQQHTAPRPLYALAS